MAFANTGIVPINGRFMFWDLAAVGLGILPVKLMLDPFGLRWRLKSWSISSSTSKAMAWEAWGDVIVKGKCVREKKKAEKKKEKERNFVHI
jgi:hypothetical protein